MTTISYVLIAAIIPPKIRKPRLFSKIITIITLIFLLPLTLTAFAEEQPDLNKKVQVARLDAKGLNDLDKNLTGEINKITATWGAPDTGAFSKSLLSEYRVAPEDTRFLEKKLPKLPGDSAVPPEVILAAIKKEIIELNRKGIEIASTPDSRPLLPLLKASGIDLPPDLKVDYEQMRYDFYWVEIVFSCLLDANVFPRKAELLLSLQDDVRIPARRTRPVRLFPSREDLQLFSVDVEGGVGIDAKLNFQVPQDRLKVIPFNKAIAADAKIKSNIVVGPFKYNFRKAAIEVKGLGDQDILWRYNMQSTLCGTNDFKSILILKVPHEANNVNIKARLGVTPCKSNWLLFSKMLPMLEDHRTLPVELFKK